MVLEKMQYFKGVAKKRYQQRQQRQQGVTKPLGQMTFGHVGYCGLKGDRPSMEKHDCPEVKKEEYNDRIDNTGGRG